MDDFDDNPPPPPARRPAAPLPPQQIVAGGRSPPHSVESEEYLLSCCLLDGADTLQQCLDSHLPPSAFYLPANRVIYSKLLDLQAKGEPVAIEGVIEALRDSRQLEAVGGVAYVMQVSGRIPTTAQAASFLRRVRDLYTRRQIIAEAAGVVERAFGEGDMDEFVEQVPDLHAIIQAGANGVLDPGRPVTDFAYPIDDDPDILIGGEDCLGRGGAFFLVSPTSTGKSPLQLDMCMSWALGWKWFGLPCSHPLKTVLIQHEDSDRYLGKIFGSFEHVHKLTKEQREMLRQNVIIRSLRGCNGDAFYRELDRLGRKHQPDLMAINPLYLYAEGDISKPESALRCITALEKINRDRRWAYFIIHHTGKPPTKKEDRQYSEFDDWEAIYMGIGSSYWANWPRFSAFVQPLPEIEGHHYLMRLGKGAENAGVVVKVPQGAGYRLETCRQIPLKWSEGKLKIKGRDRPLVIWEYDGDNEAAARGEKRVTIKRRYSEGIPMEDFLQFFPGPDEKGASIRNIWKTLATYGGQNQNAYAEMQRVAQQAGWLEMDGKEGYRRTAKAPMPKPKPPPETAPAAPAQPAEPPAEESPFGEPL